MIEKKNVIDILKRTQILLIKNLNYEAKEYITIEIENLEGITQKNVRINFFVINVIILIVLIKIIR